MEARYANVRNFNRTVKTYKWLVDLFGNKEFTSEDFAKAKRDYRRYTYNSLAFLRDEGIIKTVRTEKSTKEITIAPWEAETWMIDKDGRDFRTERKDTKTVEKKKYIYTVNPDGMLAWRKSYGRLLAERTDKIADEIVKLNEKRDTFLACQF